MATKKEKNELAKYRDIIFLFYFSISRGLSGGGGGWEGGTWGKQEGGGGANLGKTVGVGCEGFAIRVIT